MFLRGTVKCQIKIMSNEKQDYSTKMQRYKNEGRGNETQAKLFFTYG